MRQKLWGLVAACLGGAVGSADLSACSCFPPPPPVDAAMEVDLVFSGRVVAKEIVDDAEPFSPFAVTIEVTEAFKGTSAGENVVVTTGRDSAICGFFFEVGNAYLVYARGREGQFSTSLCDRTQAIARADDDLSALRDAFGQVTATLSLNGESLSMVVTGGEGRSLALEASGDLATWETLLPFAPTTDVFELTTSLEFSGPQRFFRVSQALPSQGIFGMTFFLPGPCLEDPERPGECLNLPFPGVWSYDIRAFTDSPDLGRENPILESFSTLESGEVLRVPASAAAELAMGLVPDGLRTVLAEAGWPLGPSVEIQLRREDRAWLLIDHAGQNVYYVERDGETLSVVRRGSFRVPLPVGDYCVWSFFGCEAQVSLQPGEWRFLTPSVALP